MGYVHDTATTIFIPPSYFHKVTGTWSQAAGQVTDTICITVNDADQTSTVNIPIVVPSNSSSEKGCKLKSIEIDFEIVAGALTSLAAVIYKITRGADGSAATATSVSFTYDTGHDTAGERVDVDQHKMTLTLDTAAWIDNDEYYLVELTIDQAGATDVIEFLGAFANVTLRM